MSVASDQISHRFLSFSSGGWRCEVFIGALGCEVSHRGHGLPYPIESKLVVAVASSALFDLHESDAVFQSEGGELYRAYQRKHQDDVLQPGVAFPFIRRAYSARRMKMMSVLRSLQTNLQANSVTFV